MGTKTPVNIGIIGGGYMGKAHSIAFSSVGAVFETNLRPQLEMVAASSSESAERYRASFGFNRATADWRELVNDPEIDAVVVATPQVLHREIVEATAAVGKPILCEKPLGTSLEEARAMKDAVEKAGIPNMMGFNYGRTPAVQYIRKLVAEGELGKIIHFRGEHTEDFDSDPDQPATWRSHGVPNGTMGDLAPHMINCALAVMGDITSLTAEAETVHKTRPDGKGGTIEVTNDDQAHFMCRFENGAMGHLFFSRVATGRKMGYAFEVTGTKGAVRFDMEDQNAIWLYKAEGPEAERGFRKVLTGPHHPDYLNFCQGPGHGTGFIDQIIIEARDFLNAIESGKPVWPTFMDGVLVSQIVAAAHHSNETGSWVTVSDF